MARPNKNLKNWLAALLAAVGAPAAAGDVNLRVEAEGRYFYHAQGPHWFPSAGATLEWYQGWADDKERVVTELFARADREDDARTHADLRELYYQRIGGDYEFLVGNRRVFWGVAESRHLVDIINQSDFVEDLDNEAKLGQPMLNLSLIREFGTVDLFLMPYQRARTFPGPEGHPRLPLPVAANEARYESSREQQHLDYALRYRNAFGPLDLGVAFFDGTAREPRLLPCLKRGSGFLGTDDGPNCDILSGIEMPTSPFPAPVTELLLALCSAPVPPALSGACLAPDEDAIRAEITRQVLANLVLVPYYSRQQQLSVDAQVVVESLALKLEALLRKRDGEETFASVVGFEYTFGDVWATGWDIGVLGEHLYEERDDVFASRFDHDLFAGTRIALNDVDSTQVLAGVLFDKSGNDRTFQVEASRRIGDDWKLSTKFRDFSKIPADSPTAFLRHEDMLSLTLERFF